MPMVQQELRPQAPARAEEELEELYDEEPHRRSWAAIVSVLLALALVFVGYQWHQTAGRTERLAAQMSALRAEAERERLRAEDAQRQVDGLQKRLLALGADRDTLAERVAAIEKTARARPPVSARVARPPRAVPVSTKKPR